MNDTEREERNARRRRDPNRPLEFVMLPLSTLREMVEASPRQCQDCAGMLLYLAMRPQMGNFIPGAETWGKDKCARTLQIRGRIAADCALFCRESGGIRCTAWPLEEVAQVLEKRKTYSENRKGKAGGGVQSIDCSIDAQSKEEEEEKKDIPLSQGVSFLHPPTPTQQTAPVMDGLEEGGLPQGGEIVERKPNKPNDVQEVEEAALMVLPSEMRDDAPRIAREFYETNQASEWTDEEGQPVQNWYNRLRRYCERCVNNAPRETQAHAPAAELSLLNVRRIFEDEWKKRGLQSWQMDDCISAFMQGKEDGEWRDGHFGVIRDKAKAARAYARKCAEAYIQDDGVAENEKLPPTMDNAKEYFRAWRLDDREQARAAHDFMEHLHKHGYFSNDGVKRLYWKHAAHDFAQMRYACHAAPPAPTMPDGACPRPTVEEVAAALGRYREFSGHRQESLEAYAADFLAWMDGKGWRNKVTGEPLKDWKKSCVRTYIDKIKKEHAEEEQ